MHLEELMQHTQINPEQAGLLRQILQHEGYRELAEVGSNLERAKELALLATKGHEALSLELAKLGEQLESLKRKAEQVKEQWLKEQGYNALQEAHSKIYWAKHHLEEIAKAKKNQEVLEQLGLNEGMRVYKTKERYTGGWGGKRETQEIFGYVHVVKQGDYHLLQENRQVPKVNTLIVRLEAAGQPGKRWENFSPEWKAVPVEKA